MLSLTVSFETVESLSGSGVRTAIYLWRRNNGLITVRLLCFNVKRVRRVYGYSWTKMVLSCLARTEIRNCDKVSVGKNPLLVENKLAMMY